MKRTTGHLAEKNGKWYAVINLYDTDGTAKKNGKVSISQPREATKPKLTTA